MTWRKGSGEEDSSQPVFPVETVFDGLRLRREVTKDSEVVSSMSGIGRMLVVAGLLLAGLGALLILGDRLPFRLGRLPGDIEVRGKNSVFYFPLVTCLLLSGLLSLVMWLFNRK